MNKPGLTVAFAFSLTVALVAPATAQNGRQNTHPVRKPPAAATAAGEPNLPITNALRWGYSQGYSYYPSGFGGLYGDGRYPGNVISEGTSTP